jgi:hypothetical protein
MTGAHLTALFVAAGFWTVYSVSAPAQKKHVSVLHMKRGKSRLERLLF